jgi:hypothetical protein
MVALAMVLLLSAPLPLAILPAAGAPPPFGIGDWFVTGTEVLIDRGVILDGNLTVAAGGSLTLVNSTLQLLPGPHEVRVRAGGELKILAGSSVGSFDSTERDQYRAGFWVESGARAEFCNSSFNSIGIIYRWVGSTKMGGVCIYTDDAVVDNCTFAGNYIGLTLFGSIEVTGCRFSENGWAGAISYGASSGWSRCTFEHDFFGAIAYLGSADFTDCGFNDNAIGAAADSTTARFTNCDFLRNVRTGLYVSPEQGLNPVPTASNVHVQDCLFEDNRWGLGGVFYYTDEGGNIWPLEHELFMTNSDFLNNTESGLMWDRYIPDGIARMSRSSWNITGRSEVISNVAHFKGDITVDGVLEVRSSILRIECDGAGWQDIEVRPGGRLDIGDNSTLSSATRNAFAFRCWPGSDLRLDRSLLRGCGWDPATPSRAGPFIETGNCSITRSTIMYCPTVLVFVGARGPLLEDCALSGNVTSMLLLGSEVRMLNCTLDAPGATLCRLDNASLLDCVNSTVRLDGIDLADGESRVNVSWYLDVRAAWSDGRPAGGAGLVIKDISGAEVVNATADGEGNFAGLVLKQSSITLESVETFTPHHLSCREGPVSNETEITMDASREVELVLTDSEPPSLSVTSPVPDEHVRSRQVRLSGRAQDNLALSSVMVVVDGFRRYLVYQDAGGEQWQVDWDFTVELSEGQHDLEAVALDSSGNRAQRSFSFDVDVSPPNVLITSPPNGLLTNDPELEVTGMMEAGADVDVNGVPARTMGSSFIAITRLAEGDNLVTATATDAAGNLNSSSILVRLDTVPPALDVAFSPDPAAVRDPQVGIRGTMEFGASVTVNGRRVILPGIADNFSTLYFLSPGNNTISVEATDAAGNVNTVQRSFILDLDPPAFWVLYPPEGLIPNEAQLGIVLEAEAGTNLTVGNATYAVPGRTGEIVNFSVNYSLQEGTNTILLSCRDAAGNTFSQGRQVTLDTTAPALELQSPADRSSTPGESVYVVGRTDPDATVTVNGERFEVGTGGSFSGELRLGAGRNRLVVRAQDALGNLRETTVNVTRVPAKGDTTVVGNPGPDWPFFGFLAAAAIGASGEGWWLWRRQSRRTLDRPDGPLHPSTPPPLPPSQTGRMGAS